MPRGNDDLVDALKLSFFQKLRLGLAVPVMKEILMRCWTDPAYFTGIIRAIVALLASQILNGTLVIPGTAGRVAWWMATYWGAILAFPAGQTNPTPGVIKASANDPSVQVTRQDIRTADAAKVASEKTPPGM